MHAALAIYRHRYGADPAPDKSEVEVLRELARRLAYDLVYVWQVVEAEISVDAGIDRRGVAWSKISISCLNPMDMLRRTLEIVATRFAMNYGLTTKTDFAPGPEGNRLVYTFGRGPDLGRPDFGESTP